MSRPGRLAAHPRFETGRPVTTSIPYLLAYAFTVTTQRADRELRRHGLTIRQLGLLAQLREEPELTTSELARQLGVSRQSLHEMINGLEQTAYLRREPGASGRTRRLVLTPRAEQLLTRLSGPLLQLEDELVAGMSQAEIQTLRRSLQRFLAHVTDDEAWLSDG